jgi:hypothetical protein
MQVFCLYSLNVFLLLLRVFGHIRKQAQFRCSGCVFDGAELGRKAEEREIFQIFLHYPVA